MAIDHVDDQFDMICCRAVTDRGPIELQIKHADDVRHLENGRLLVKDHAGGTFVIEDLRTLDPHSRRLAESLGG